LNECSFDLTSIKMARILYWFNDIRENMRFAMHARKLISFLFFAQLLWTNFCVSTRYTYSSMQPCEECEENSKLFYGFKNKTLCRGCAVAYLSFNSSTQDARAIKFYMKDIIYHELNEKKHKWTIVDMKDIIYHEVNGKTFATSKWEIVSNAVNRIWTTYSSIFEKRKKENKNFNLFLLTNELLDITFKTKLFITRKVCTMCFLGRFSLLKLQCCHKQICIKCYFSIKNETCTICKKHVCKNKNELLRSVCSAVGRIMNLEEELKQNVPEIKRQKAESFIKNILQNQKSDHCLPTQNQVEEVMKFDNQNLVIPWSYILEPEKETTRNLKMPGKIWIAFLSIGTILPQVVIAWHQNDLQDVSSWILMNSLLTNFIFTTNPFHSWHPDENKILSEEAHLKILTIVIQNNKFFLNWINFLFCYYFFGPQFYTKYEGLLFLILFSSPMLHLHRWLLQIIYDICIEDIFYQFY